MRLLVLASSTASILVGIVAVAARAETEGPLFIVEHALRGGGESDAVTATAKSSFVFKSPAAKSKIECKALKLKAGATINGSARQSAGTGKATFEFAKCEGGAKGEALAGCEPESGKITTAPTVDTVGWANSSRTGPVLVLVAPEVGTTFASVKFTGENCITSSAVVAGRVIGEDFASGNAVEVGSNEIETVKPEIKFGSAGKAIWTENSGSLTSIKSTLSLAGIAATFEGDTSLELVSQQPWGVFPRPEFYGDAYAFTPPSLLFHEVVGEEQAFTVEDVGSSHLELRNLKIGGSEASKWRITDKNLCAVKTLVTLGRCGVTVELLVANAGAATFEGEVRFEASGRQFSFPAKALANP